MNNIHDGSPILIICDVYNYEFPSLKGMRIHRNRCIKKRWWKDKMDEMISNNHPAPTCEDIARAYNDHFGLNQNKPSYSATPPSNATLRLTPYHYQANIGEVNAKEYSNLAVPKSNATSQMTPYHSQTNIYEDNSREYNSLAMPKTT